MTKNVTIIPNLSSYPWYLILNISRNMTDRKEWLIGIIIGTRQSTLSLWFRMYVQKSGQVEDTEKKIHGNYCREWPTILSLAEEPQILRKYHLLYLIISKSGNVFANSHLSKINILLRVTKYIVTHKTRNRISHFVRGFLP